MAYQPSLFDYDYSQGMPPRPSHWDPIPVDEMNVGNLSSELPTIDASNPQLNKASMFPDISNINWSGILEGGKNLFGFGNNEPPTNINRPILDAYQQSPHRGFGDVTTPPYMFQDMTVDEGRIPGRVQEELPTKKGFQFPNFGITGVLQGLAGANTPEENFARDYFKDSMDSSGRIYNNAEDLFGGKIPVSAFGKGMSAAGQKRIDTLNATLAKWEADKEKYAKQLRTTTLYDRRNKFQKQLDSYNRDLASAGAVTNVTNPNIERTTGGPDMNIRSFDPGLARAMGSYDRRAGPMGGPGYGPFSRAEGGRIGYANGELVDEDINIQGPNFDVNENIEMTSGGGEGDILEQLVAKYIEAGFPPEQAQVMAMQELQQMVAQSGQGEGIASLV